MPRGGSKKGERRGGRKKGTPNKTSAEVKAALLKAFDEMGGVESLVKWGKKNPTQFYALWGRLIPTEIKNADDKPFRMTFGEDVRRRLADVDGGGPGQPGETGRALPAELADAAAPPGD